MKISTLATITLLLGFSFSPATAQEDRLAYRLHDVWPENPDSSTVLHVTQSGAATVARFEPDGKLALLSHPDRGIRSARRDRSLPFLVEAISAPAGYGPGYRKASDFGGVEVVDAIRFELQRGDSDRTLEGHAAEHRVLTVELEWHTEGEDGSLQTNRAEGRADLWTATDLPFSWVPYTFPYGFAMAPIPLSFDSPQAAAHVLTELAGELEGLGLLLRAEVKSTIDMGVDDGGVTQERAREVRIEGLEQGAGPLEAAELDLPVLTVERYEALFGGMMLAGSGIRQAMQAGPSPLTWETNEPKKIVGAGTARLFHESDEDDASVLVLGSPEDEAGCVVVFVEPRGPEAAEHSVLMPSDAWEAAKGPKAVALFLRGNRESNRTTLLESGTLTFSETAGGKLRAELRGTGWTADMTPDSPSLTEGVAFELVFDVEKAP